MKRLAVVAAGAAAVLLVGCSSASPTAPAPTEQSFATAPAEPAPSAGPDTFFRVADGASLLASGLPAPWSVVPLAEGGALISLRDFSAVQHLMPDGSVVLAGTLQGVDPFGEGGLLGLAVWQDGDARWLYAYESTAEENRVVRIPMFGEGGELTLGDAEAILGGIARANIHNGGRIAFGPDGLLYVATGDAGGGATAQDPASLNGKILRITPTGEPAPGNPFGTAVFSLGHRNVQGLAWTADGTLYASEFGQDTWDELNRIVPGGNYGWPVVEGQTTDPAYQNPVAQWTTDQASPSGLAAIGDTVFMAGLRGARLWQIDVDGGVVVDEPIAAVSDQGRLRDVVVAPDGALWVLTSNTDGRGDARDDDDLLLRVPVTAE